VKPPARRRAPQLALTAVTLVGASAIALVAVGVAGCGSHDDPAAPTASPGPAAPSVPDRGPAPAAPAPAPPVPTPPSPLPPPDVAAALTSVREAARCSDTATPSPLRPWCLGAVGWDLAVAGDVPEGDHVLLGLRVHLAPTIPAGDALLQNVGVAAVATRRTGDTVLAALTDITPDDESEQRVLAAATFSLSAFFKGMAPVAEIDPSLTGFTASLPGMADHAAVRGARGWQWQGAALGAELRRSGDTWIAVERPDPPSGAVTLTILTEHVQARAPR